MILTEKQISAKEKILDRYFNKTRNYAVLSGYAGTGKSTCISYIIADLLDMDEGLDEKEICYVAYTGQGCKILKQKGNQNVMTLHKLLYNFVPAPNGEYYRTEKDSISPYKVVVVDEYSMVPKDMVDLLLKHRVFVIFCGDPAQLPPIKKESGNTLFKDTDFFLDEILRQASQSDIISYSKVIREGQALPDRYNGNDLTICQPQDLTAEMVINADVVICATNATRVWFINKIRELKGISGNPQPGEQVICLKNYWDKLSDDGEPLVNGTIGTLGSPWKANASIPRYIGVNKPMLNYIISDINCGDDHFSSCRMDYDEIMNGTPQLDSMQEYKLSKNKKEKFKVPYHFTFGYAITCHKAQGAQWDNVLIIEEDFPYGQEHIQWLYTAVTRSVKKCTLVRKSK